MLNETSPTLDSSRHSKGMNASPKETLSCAIPADFIAARPHHSVAKETGEGGISKFLTSFNDRIYYGKNICNMTIFVIRNNRQSSKDANYFRK